MITLGYDKKNTFYKIFCKKPETVRVTKKNTFLPETVRVTKKILFYPKPLE